MKKANIEFVEFDAKDVITTSNNIIPSNVTVIWMTKESVEYYNSVKNNDIKLYMSTQDEAAGGGYYSYYAYGNGSVKDNVLSENSKTNNRSDVDVLISVTNDFDYVNVLNWLANNNSNFQKPVG